MNKQHIYRVEGMNCHSCEVLIKEGLIKLPNIKTIEVSASKGEVTIEYEGDKPNLERLNDIFREEEFIFSDKQVVEDSAPVAAEVVKSDKTDLVTNVATKEHVYNVKGMHCASCEILIEKKLLDLQNIKSVDASTAKEEVVIEYEGDRPNPERLSKIFKEENYIFSDLIGAAERKNPVSRAEGQAGKKTNATLVAFNIAIFIIIAFLLLQKMGIANFISLDSTSSLFAFLGFGFLAGMSSCAALVGGIVLSMSKQWNSLYSEDQSASKKLQPHIMFNAGRVISYVVLGGVLGMIGSRLQISPQFTAFLIVAVSFLMVALGLQMLGVKAFRKFQVSAPKTATRYIANENNFQGKHMPFIMGALTFFLPCGFTIMAQSLALLSGNVFQGALIMGAFALGTVPSLLFIGLSSVKFSSKPHLAERFSKVAGFLVLFFALFNMSYQANVLGFTGFSNIIGQNQTQNVADEKDLPPIIDGKQVIKMIAYSSKDVPNYFKVRAGIPVRWEITADSSAGGCNSSIISGNLFSGAIPLTPGQVSVKEFTPQKTGKFRFSCQMGMISGIIEVVNASNASSNSGIETASAASSAVNDQVVPSGASGCGCGGGGGNACGAK
ncbi:MAG: hypothetical protein A2812_02790 [Candidatus Staskawiczbacteria bacterium RIFCSPHIGHO2_01_FULL_36_16]|uniref:HMA domain-containing protein n=1 Tax=Candidatus Staskawiczbacteria bacterium RIFCSPHIGHO2_01_FULL_36_16 TaxID=1802200 RepID=A0A1G2HLW6_9BACT|nr:MAG: hypothetical protein A2812_02790 [Candidatus Staskawiczbacteria bacterium RIFCSPHIGHO2_01_FULL_36_16]